MNFMTSVSLSPYKIKFSQVWYPSGGTSTGCDGREKQASAAIFTWSPGVSSAQEMRREESGIWATLGNVNWLTLIIWTAETLTVHEAWSLDIACTVQILTEGTCADVWGSCREEGHAVFLCESGTKRGHAVVRAWGRRACAEVIYSALTYSCRWSALCSKLHTPKGIECVSQLTFRVGKHTDEKGWGYSGALSLRRSPRHTLTSLQFQPQCLLTKLHIYSVCVCVYPLLSC